jgi:hypothetical protein
MQGAQPVESHVLFTHLTGLILAETSGRCEWSPWRRLVWMLSSAKEARVNSLLADSELRLTWQDNCTWE